MALTVLSGVALLNYLDRYIVASLVNRLTEPEPVGLGLSHAQAGWLASGFVIVYLLTSPVFGALADRYSRPRLIALGVVIWAIATAAGAFAGGFAILLAARSLVGVGEAAYGTAAPALLADAFPRASRGRIFSVFYATIPVGAALGFALGGLIEAQFGWRAAFMAAGIPGLILALWVLCLKDPPRGGNDPDHSAPIRKPATRRNPLATVRNYLRLFAIPGFVLPVLGYAAYTFALGALAFWMPDYLEQVRGLSVREATVGFGASFAVTGLLGTLCGGWLADRLLARTPRAYLWVSGIAMALSVPLLWLALTAEAAAVYLTTIVLAEFLVFVPTGPVNSAIINAVPPADRAKAMAASILAIHVLGDVPSPPLVGYLADLESLETALLLVPAAALVAAFVWLAAAVRRSRG